MQIGGRIGFEHRMYILGVVQVLASGDIGLDRSVETTVIKLKERHRRHGWRESDRGVSYNAILSHPVPVVLVVIEVNILLVVEDAVAAEHQVTTPTEPIGDTYSCGQFDTGTVRVLDVGGLHRAYIVVFAG